MQTKLTILCENSVGRPFGVVGEHGFACFIETEAGNVLFDTGQGMGICGNAAVLGKNLASIQAIAISHGHYDHTGGLPQVLEPDRPGACLRPSGYLRFAHLVRRHLPPVTSACATGANTSNPWAPNSI